MHPSILILHCCLCVLCLAHTVALLCVDPSTMTFNEVMSSVAELNCGSVAFRCVPWLALLVPKVEKCSTFREATHASANQIAFHANTAAQALANQIAFMLTSKEHEAQMMADQTP